MKTRLIYAGIVLAILLLLLLQGCARQQAKSADPARLPVEATPAQIRPMAREILLTGSIKPIKDASIAANFAERVLAVQVREGDRVRAGQVLVELDPTSTRARLQQALAAFQAAQSQLASAEAAYESQRVTAPSRVAQARAALVAAQKRLAIVRQGARSQERAVALSNVRAAKSNLDKASSDLRRAEQLFGPGAISREQLDSTRNRYEQAQEQHRAAQEQYNLLEAGPRQEEVEAAQATVQQAQADVTAARAGLRQIDISRTGVESARAGLEQAQAAVTSARNDLANTTLRAPITGVVYQRSVDVGNVPGSGDLLLKIAALERLYFEATVPEREFALLAVGQPVSVTVDALPGQTFAGRVERLVPVASAESRDFMARIAVSNPQLRLRPGMFARGRVLVEAHPNAIVVPNEALLGQPGRQTVFVAKGDRAEMRDVVTGLQDVTRTEILSGVAAGEDVVVAGQQGLTSGQRVTVTRRQ